MPLGSSCGKEIYSRREILGRVGFSHGKQVLPTLPSRASPSIAKHGGSRSEVWPWDDNFTYILPIKKKYYSLDSGVSKSLVFLWQVGACGSKSSCFSNTEKYQISNGDHKVPFYYHKQTQPSWVTPCPQPSPLPSDILDVFVWHPLPLPGMLWGNNNFKCPVAALTKCSSLVFHWFIHRCLLPPYHRSGNNLGTRIIT